MKISIGETISRISKGDISAMELAETLLERIEKFDTKIKSCKAVNLSIIEGEAGLKEIRKTGKRPRELMGIPISVKDLIDTKGLATTYGSPLYFSNIPKQDARILTNLKKAGGIILCKTNTHEFALGIETPPTKNPWDLTRIPGGSSGGSAAALAADLAVMAIGTDTGGSIRIPASMCGITGLKPTYGVLPLEGIFPEAFSLDHVGPMCRFASDLPLLLKAMGYQRPLKRIYKKLRAGLETTFLDQSTPCVRAKVREFVNLSVSEGFIEVKEFGFPGIEDVNNAHTIIDTAEIAYAHREIYEKNKETYLATSAEQVEIGRKVRATEYIQALKYRNTTITKFLATFKDMDLIITPALPTTAPTIEEVKKMTLKEHYPFIKFLEAFNFLELPAITIPCGFCQGLPVGVQFISNKWSESTLISLAERYQEVSDWHIRVPPQFGELPY